MSARKGGRGPAVVVVHNRDFEGAEADPENQARADVMGVVADVASALRADGCVVTLVGVTADVIPALQAVRAARPDVVFNLCESLAGDNRFEPLVPFLLELEGVAFTGAGSFGLSLALRKDRAKEVLRSRGVPTPASALVRTPADLAAVAVPFPAIVKPSREDASVGVTAESVVADRAAMEARVRHVLQRYRQPALVERYVAGREIYASVLGRAGGAAQVLPFFEIDFSAMPPDRPRIVSYEGKWVKDSVDWRGTTSVPCRGLSATTAARARAAALAAFDALEMRDYGRVDFRLGGDGVPYVIDVNPNCDLSAQGGGFAKAARAAGLGYGDVVRRILDRALLRARVASIAVAPSPPILRRASGAKTSRRARGNAGTIGRGRGHGARTS